MMNKLFTISFLFLYLICEATLGNSVVLASILYAFIVFIVICITIAILMSTKQRNDNSQKNYNTNYRQPQLVNALGSIQNCESIASNLHSELNAFKGKAMNESEAMFIEILNKTYLACDWMSQQVHSYFSTIDELENRTTNEIIERNNMTSALHELKSGLNEHYSQFKSECTLKDQKIMLQRYNRTLAKIDYLFYAIDYCYNNKIKGLIRARSSLKHVLEAINNLISTHSNWLASVMKDWKTGEFDICYSEPGLNKTETMTKVLNEKLVDYKMTYKQWQHYFLQEMSFLDWSHCRGFLAQLDQIKQDVDSVKREITQSC
ncbi:uncharacterized protein LOC107367143 [Tetranychus urticae]|uniref:Uncharacterized protein n=1 Tax=Tetranychus urticae TaxID=32264 RepID=T1KTV4_TETUR|nr:uncharacterized protein LOC107367143 [Tetranychus urticae]